MVAARAYWTEYGDWPQGDATGVTRSLSGDNPRKIVFLEIGGSSTTGGAAADAWGTSLTLSFSGERVSVTSAGKDKTFGTADDLILSAP